MALSQAAVDMEKAARVGVVDVLEEKWRALMDRFSALKKAMQTH